MAWVIVGVVLVVATLWGIGAWFLAPSLRLLRRPDFEPASKDDASVERAQQSGTSTGAGGAGA